MATNQDEWIIDPAQPKSRGVVAMMNRKVGHCQEAYRAACFWHQLQQVNPHYADLCAQQVKVQWGWAQANSAECLKLNETLKAEGTSREDLVDLAQWWAVECTTLLAECEKYDPATAPAWAQKRISAIDSRLVDSGRANGWLVGNCPAVGFYIMLYGGKAPNWHVENIGAPPESIAYDQVKRIFDFVAEEDTEPDFYNVAPEGEYPPSTELQPLDIVEDRTTEQKLADGDLPAPTHCTSCGAELWLHESKAAPYLYCAECSDPARYYVVDYGVGKLYLKPKKKGKAQ